jgi:hypothetical protein
MTKRTLVLAAALCTAAAFGQTTSDPNDNPIQVLNHPTPPATQFLTTNSSWQSLPYQQGAMLFTDTKTKRTAILGNVTHQDPQSGAWVQNDPSLSSTNNGWRIDGTANQILIDKSGTSLHIVTQTYTDYATKHNSVLGVTFPTLTYDSGFLFHFTQNGLTWDLRFRQAGFFEFEATVATKVGAATYSFPVTSSETLTVNAAGQLAGNNYVALNRAVMLPRFGKAAPCSVWSYSKAGIASFTCDDSVFTAKQLPYRIDPASNTVTSTDGPAGIDAYDDGQGDSGNDYASFSDWYGFGAPAGATNVSYSCSFTTDWSSLEPGDTIACNCNAPGSENGNLVPSNVIVNILPNNPAPYSDSAEVSDVQMTFTWTARRVAAARPAQLNPSPWPLPTLSKTAR